MSPDAQILRALRSNGGAGVSGAELSQQLRVSRAAVWARIHELRGLGYDIEASPHAGYRLRRVPDVLHADDLLARLPESRVVGRDIRVFQETASTNDSVDKLGRDGVAEGIVVFAEKQTRGRGRLGRAWVSPAGKGLWFSLLLRPPWPPQSATWITIAAANALVRAIRSQTRVRPQIKWPNDILADGKKICGVLTELAAEIDTIKYVVLGVGVDVNQEASDFPAELAPIATSLRLAQGEPVHRADLAAEILAQLEVEYQRLLRGEFSAAAEEWEGNCSTLGKLVSIQQGGRTLAGRAEALDAQGALLVRTQHGHLERVLGGDVATREGES
jgi:BirA family biotin operon repressor/biotin-[acetyl-CoA-carboxylase] ligase